MQMNMQIKSFVRQVLDWLKHNNAHYNDIELIVDLFKNFQPMGYLKTFHTLLRMKWNIKMENKTKLGCKNRT